MSNGLEQMEVRRVVRAEAGESDVPMAPITFDAEGRMEFHPDFHGKHNRAWTTTDERFLIDNYETLGAEAVSLHLERTIQSIMRRVCNLRAKGRMAPPPTGTRAWHKRTITVKSVAAEQTQ